LQAKVLVNTHIGKTYMIKWNSSDVGKLFTLADGQLSCIPSASKDKALAKSSKYTRVVCNMNVCYGLKVKIPLFYSLAAGGKTSTVYAIALKH